MTHVFLMRHAEAVDGERTDSSRGLTDDGRYDAKKMGKWLRKSGIEIDLVLSSDYVRAAETVERVLKGYKHNVPTAELDELEPNATPATALKACQRIADEKKADSVLVVTHHPLIGWLLPYVIGLNDANWTDAIGWHHGAIAYVHGGAFHWLVTPKIAERDDDLVDVEEAARNLAFAFSENLRVAAHAAVVNPLVVRMRALIGRRFKRQLAAFLRNGLPKLRPHVQPGTEADSHLIRTATASLSRVVDKRFRSDFPRLITQAYRGGAKTALTALNAIEAKKPVAQQSLPAWYARLKGPDASAAQLEEQIDGTTEARIAVVIEDTWGKGLKTMVSAIRETFADWAGEEDRIDTIALDQVSGAYNQGIRDAGRAAGVPEKRWVTEEDACEICEENAAEGTIPNEAPFSSGDFEPPAHPHCRCSLEIGPAEDEGEEE
jgi:phosphohistidine phosphatase